jgi:hypothetical protein
VRKQSTMHRRSRSLETETAATNFPAPARTETQPKGLHTRDRFKPTHLNAGAAESNTQPVEMPHRADKASASPSQFSAGRTDESQIDESGKK